MLTPKLIPIEQLEKADIKSGGARGADKLFERHYAQEGGASVSDTKREPAKPLESQQLESKRDKNPDIKSGGAKGADKNWKLSQKQLEAQHLDKVVAALEKAARAPHFTTSRERRARAGAKGTGFGAAAHTADTSWSQNMEKSSLYKAFGVQMKPQNLTSSLPLYKMDMAIDLYDGVLQKADMNWDNVPEEDLVRLEKILGLRNPFKGKEKSDREKTESTGLDASAVRNGKPKKEAPNVGFFNKPITQAEAQRQVRQRRSKEVDAAMKTVKEGRAERLARGIGRFAGRAKQKIDQRENIGRKIGEAKDAGIAAGKEGIARGKEGIAEGRRRGSAIKDLARQGKDIAITGQRSESDRFASGGVVRVNKPTWQVGANKTKEDHTEKFKPKTYDNPYRSSLQDKAQKAAGQQAARGGLAAASAQAKKQFESANQMSMETAVISLQKFLDNDCGCEGDSLMQNARTKEQQQAGETKRAGGEGFGVDPKTFDPYNELSPEQHAAEQKAGMTRDRRDWAGRQKGRSFRGVLPQGTPKSRLAAKRGESPDVERLPWVTQT